MECTDVSGVVGGKQSLRKLLFIVNVDWFFLSHRLPIALAAIDAGYEVHIATGFTDHIKQIQSYGLIVHPLSLHRSDISLESFFSTFREISAVFKLVKPDVVHLVTIKPVLIGGLAARFAQVPSVVSAISGKGFVFVSRGLLATARRVIVAWLYRLALGHKNQRVIFQNLDDRDSIIRITGMSLAKSKLIHGSGVDLDLYSVTPTKTAMPIVILAARLIADKGVREFVEAARYVNSKIKMARFVLVGEPDLSNPASLSQHELTEYKDKGFVELWGHRSDMSQVLSSAQIVVLPSYYGEGLPKVLIEAAACGRVIVTTDHPGCRDAIESNVTGLLVPVRDSKALGEAIKLLLDDPVRCETMGKAGRERAEKLFDVRDVVSAHLSIYQKLMEQV
jgi:glycosyltransferase involved in cell wall biosynthesis